MTGPFVASAGQTDFPADYPLISPLGLRVRRQRGEASVVLSGAAVSAFGLRPDGFTARLVEPCLAGDRIWVFSELPASRLRAHTPNGNIRTATLEGDAEEAQAQLQELRRDLGQVYRVAPGETVPTPEELAELAASVQDRAARTGSNILAAEAPLFRQALKQNFRTPEDFGAIGDGVEDDTAAIVAMVAAVAAGANIQGMAGKTYVITDTVVIAKRANWDGNGATIRYEWRTAKGGPGFCRPMLVFAEGSEGSRFSNFNMNHDGWDCPGAKLAAAPGQPPETDGLPLAWQCALIVQSDDVNVSNCRIDNAWDNAFTVGRYTVTGTGTAADPYVMPFSSISLARPKRVTFANCHAYRAGAGKHYYPSPRLAGGWERVGAGFNNLNAGFARFDNCVAYLCATGFVTDFGAQASSTFVDCMAYESREDVENPNNGSGWGFWIADGPNLLVGCQAFYCKKQGFVIPYEANGTVLSGCIAFANGYDGFLIGSNKTTLTGCVSQANGTRADAEKAAAYVLDSSGEELTAVVMVGNVALHNEVSQHGLRARGANTIVATWMGGHLEGRTAATDIGTYAIAVFTQGPTSRNIGFGTEDPRSRFQIAAGATDHKIIPVGDTGNGAALALSAGGANVLKKIAFGYDIANDLGVIQCLHEGIGKKPLLLNPSGGDVGLGIGAWNTGHPIINGTHIWSDGAGVLRFKFGAPASATDASAGQVIARTFLARDFYSSDGVYTYDAGGSMYVRKEGAEIGASHTMRAPAFTPVCDINLKWDIRPIEGEDVAALDRLSRAVATVHKRKAEGEDGPDHRGFIAQWLREDGCGHWTVENAETGLLAFDPVACLTDVVMAIRELRRQVAVLSGGQG